MNIEVKKSIKPQEYNKTIKLLEKRVIDVSMGLKRELLWILEHKSTYTSGKSSEDGDLIDKKTKLIKTNRGGKLTYHSPGQKVVYFVLNLNKRNKDIRKLINKIEDCIFWYKAPRITESWQFGCDEFWMFHHERFNKNYVPSVV